MFTGIILTVGKILEVQAKAGDFRLKIALGKIRLEAVDLGDSIAVNGVCLTVVELGVNYFWADVSNETLAKTIFKSAKAGASVNLELALTPTTRLGGHIVNGHVDGLGTVITIQQDGRSYCYQFKAPDELAKYITKKGSICINGVSLTVNEVNEAIFSVNIVPHTIQETNFSELTIGTAVNLETDILARYMERLLQKHAPNKPSSAITEELLQNYGFLE